MVKEKNCPNCNSEEVKAYLNAPDTSLQPWYHVVCLSCGISAPTIEVWNSLCACVIKKINAN